MININWNQLDNYILLIASFLSALSAGIGDPALGLIILAVGMILKAIGSAIDPQYTLIQNLDNVALALAGVFSILVTLMAPNETLTVAIMIIGFFLKAVGSAYSRHADLATNIDNVILAITVTLSAVLTSFGYIQAAFYATTIGGFLKAILSAYVRTQNPPPIGTAPTSSI